MRLTSGLGRASGFRAPSPEENGKWVGWAALILAVDVGTLQMLDYSVQKPSPRTAQTWREGRAK